MSESSNREGDSGSPSEAGSTRAATLIGVGAAAIAVAWIVLLGTGSAAVLLLAGVFVGIVYSNRPIPAHRAGIRTGLIVAIPEVGAQLLPTITTGWGSSMSLSVPIWLAAIVVFVLGPVAILIGASLCVIAAAVSGWIATRGRALLPGGARSDGQ